MRRSLISELHSTCWRAWGPHTINCFASVQREQQAMERYRSTYRNPGCELVDVFTVTWSKEKNWLFPPPYLIPHVLRLMSAGGEHGALFVPQWPSAVWWPLLVEMTGSWRAFVNDVKGFFSQEQQVAVFSRLVPHPSISLLFAFALMTDTIDSKYPVLFWQF